MKSRSIVPLAFALALLSAITGCERDTPSRAERVSAVSAQVGSPPAAAPAMDLSREKTSEADFSGRAVASGAAGFATRGPTSLDVGQNVSVGETAPAAPSMLIRTGQAYIEVDKVDPAIVKLRQLAAQVGGYITNSSVSGGRDQMRQATLELKIPAPKYDQAVSSLSTIGKVETVTTSAQDVGEEYVDVTARVDNAKRLEQRLIALLATRTGKLEEVLSVERELARVREQIERYEGRLRFLSSRVAVSTLTVTVHEPAPILGNAPGENPLVGALRRAWRNFIGFIAGLIASLGVIIPLAAIGVLAWYVYRRWVRYWFQPKA
ncbi:MAG: DUF4349 domain-containing protein [Gemmatimonadaceae bacterium]